jgi:signal transduction histidine kinase
LWSQRTNAAYAARVDMAYAQALQVTRLERAAATLGPADAPGRAALRASAEAYLASIAAEARLLGEDGGDQAAELARAKRLIAAIMAGGSARDLAETRRLASAIAAAEVREAGAARRRAEAAAARTRNVVMATAAAVLLVPLALLIALQRLLVAPLRRLEAASDELAQAQHPGERLAPYGLREIRQLTLRFNAMAEAVEARVAARTAALARANADLAAVDQRRRRFLAKVSHELRTPVTAIRGEAEVALGHAAGPDDRAEALSQIRQSSLFLGRRLDDLMLLARAEDAQLPMGEGRCDPFAAARRACTIAAAYARTGDVTLSTAALPGDDTPGAPGAIVAGDADRVQQAIAAVIDNAIKFSPPGGAITVSGALEHGAAVVRVADQGPGVAAADLPRIFDPWVQGTSGRALGGTGLGLSLARFIAEAYGGTITAEPGGRGADEGSEGLCVTLRLPITG